MPQKKKNSNNHPKAEKWEIDAVGRFLLQLNRQKVFLARSNYFVPKNVLRDEFVRFLLNPENIEISQRIVVSLNDSKIKVDGLLYRTGYFINTVRGSEHYQIKNLAIEQYRTESLAIHDEKHMSGEPDIADESNEAKASANSSPLCTLSQPDDNKLYRIDSALAPYLTVDDDALRHTLSFEGTATQSRKDFHLTDWSCYICQEHFETANDYEEHVKEHGDEGDFKRLMDLKKFEPLIEVSYQSCKNSHYFCFTIAAKLRNTVIEKIIFVQSRSMFDVRNTRLPFELSQSPDQKDVFYVDSHLFTTYLVQPIVIVFHSKLQPSVRVIEQHNLMCVDEFLAVRLPINPYRLPNAQTFKPKINLSKYMPPVEIRKDLSQPDGIAILKEKNKKFKEYSESGQLLTPANIYDVYKLLLQIEDLDAYDQYYSLTQRNVLLQQVNSDISLKFAKQLHLETAISVDNIIVPYDEVVIIPEAVMKGLEEPSATSSRPDLFLCDTKKTQSSNMGRYYYGQVQRVGNGRVWFNCEKKIPPYERFTVIFRPLRLQLRYQYRALDMLVTMPQVDMRRFLFPQVVPSFLGTLHMPTLQLYNERIAVNAEQLEAVRNIAAGPRRDAPYIILGPPGTGKTATIVEAILQLYVRRPDTKVLVTAGSNSACDEVALRLCKAQQLKDESRSIVRIYSRSMEKRSENLNELLLERSNLYDTHFYPSVEELHGYRIVVATLSTVAKLCTGNFGRDANGLRLFTHIFVDECAASTEAEALMALVGTVSQYLIIAGDHKQLGPILYSERAQKLGLGTSLLERLVQRDCYRVDETGNYDHSLQTRLCCNFRSHARIVSLFSRLYYEDKLLALANQSDVSELGKKWYRLPNPNFPIMFHAVFGTSGRDSSSTSMYNNKELNVVMDYVKDLMYFGVQGEKISEKDIGIISPYKKQYLNIREQLNLRKWYGIETGSVETFQGKEKTIIIVSFVRSFTSTLGFLDNPRRLNVTLSRPKSLLILVGNPKTLSINDDFSFIIEECKRHNTMVGGRMYDDKGKTKADQEMRNPLKQRRDMLPTLMLDANAGDAGDAPSTSKQTKATTVQQQPECSTQLPRFADNVNGNSNWEIPTQISKPCKNDSLDHELESRLDRLKIKFHPNVAASSTATATATPKVTAKTTASSTPTSATVTTTAIRVAGPLLTQSAYVLSPQQIVALLQQREQQQQLLLQLREQQQQQRPASTGVYQVDSQMINSVLDSNTSERNSLIAQPKQKKKRSLCCIS